MDLYFEKVLCPEIKEWCAGWKGPSLVWLGKNRYMIYPCGCIKDWIWERTRGRQFRWLSRSAKTFLQWSSTEIRMDVEQSWGLKSMAPNTVRMPPKDLGLVMRQWWMAPREKGKALCHTILHVSQPFKQKSISTQTWTLYWPQTILLLVSQEKKTSPE